MESNHNSCLFTEATGVTDVAWYQEQLTTYQQVGINHFLFHKIVLSRYGIFLGEMYRHLSHKEEQKSFAAARLFWSEGCLRDFFWPEEGRKTRVFFVLPNDEKCCAFRGHPFSMYASRGEGG